jgi:hypothetical protein
MLIETARKPVESKLFISRPRAVCFANSLKRATTQLLAPYLVPLSDLIIRAKIKFQRTNFRRQITKTNMREQRFIRRSHMLSLDASNVLQL